MNGRFLLDTNIVIAIFSNDKLVMEPLEMAEEVFVPIIVLGELYFGAQKSKKVGRNLTRINEFAQSSSVLICDTETSRQYGEIKNFLRAKGRPIPENDIWIAAIAKQHELTLISRDDHFKEIEDFLTLTW